MDKSLKASLLMHGAIFLFIFIQGLYFNKPLEPYVPTLRVDLVGLPDQLKKDLDKIAPKGKPESAPEVKAEQKKEAPSPQEEDELAFNPKSKKKSKKSDKELEKERQDRLKNALNRIKALNRIQESAEDKGDDTVVKGNQISRGTTLVGDAKESRKPSYFDVVLQRLQSNWSLPIWLARQNLSAQVQIHIDSRGNVRHLKFVKPSGNPQFDETVEATIRASEPFPAPPIAFRASTLNQGILLGFPL